MQAHTELRSGLDALKREVLAANVGVSTSGLAVLTWGNASGLDPETGYVVIKGSGVEYDSMTVDDLAVVDLDGRPVEGTAKPSTDLPVHLELYRNFPGIRGVVHTHSPYATVWAQLGSDIPCYGTTHADYFPGPVPCTRLMGAEELGDDYEQKTGQVIVEAFRDRDPQVMRAALVRFHGPFVWGNSPLDALHNAVVLEYVAAQAYRTAALGEGAEPQIGHDLMERHYERKFGKDAYYGQR